ncbi:MAG: hypothetical protein HN981_01430 [Candidatus Pacebacteria bacterium]|nr:hypothetical protein [Candidatus Paceibacterota bacterium]MBT4652667.1 hypothetical protein [Candidatus Paceibacterota bacterium]MBT6755824.1 hypothetical protein [Candidatus Paceibacterota bacterium]MBT6921037.1 hypothetical protein [Candidatus Paceibacterota bacterium]
MENKVEDNQENEVFKKLRELLAFATGHSVEEIFTTSLLEEDLGINLEEDFPRLIAVINQSFEIELEIYHVLNELEEAEDSVEQLAKLVEEEVELG